MLLNTGLHQIRGFAVLMVVLFHTTWDVFAGGFAGVDMFFLLSGYLIASKLVGVKNSKQVTRFYIKRVRKIFPSLITSIILTVALFWWLWGWCEDTFLFIQHGLSTLFGFSNIVFAYNATVEQHSYSPFLHLWSVAIEIQFYLFAPLLLLLVNKTRIKTLPLLYVITFISFTTYIILTIQDAMFAYYFTGSRVWLFTLGAIIFLTPASPQRTNNIFITVGATTLLTYFMFYILLGDTTPTYSLFPVFSTVLIMLGVKNVEPEKTAETKWFKKPLLWLADISYPLYLVHYPVMFFTYNYYQNYMWVALIFSTLLAALVHMLVEKPFMSKQGLKTV